MRKNARSPTFFDVREVVPPIRVSRVGVASQPDTSAATDIEWIVAPVTRVQRSQSKRLSIGAGVTRIDRCLDQRYVGKRLAKHHLSYRGHDCKRGRSNTHP